MSERKTDEQWRMATGYETPNAANAALLAQAETIRALTDALEAYRDGDNDARSKTLAALAKAGRLP